MTVGYFHLHMAEIPFRDRERGRGGEWVGTLQLDINQ